MIRVCSVLAALAAMSLGCGQAAASTAIRTAAGGPEPPPCTCRTPAGSVALGDSACLVSPLGRRQARCVMVLNNTSWEFTDETCGPVSLLSR